jgi:hypothetical protein
MVSKNRVLKIFGTKRKDERGKWRNLHNEEFHDDFCSSQALLGY